MPGLIRGVVRAVIVAGTAAAVSNRVAHWRADRHPEPDLMRKYPQQGHFQRHAAPEPDKSTVRYEQYPYEPPPPEPNSRSADELSARLEQLHELGKLKSLGLLTAAEFQAQKQHLFD
jgi:hypothetical protein